MSRGISFKLVSCCSSYIYFYICRNFDRLFDGGREGKVMKYKSQGIKIFTGQILFKNPLSIFLVKNISISVTTQFIVT